MLSNIKEDLKQAIKFMDGCKYHRGGAEEIIFHDNKTSSNFYIPICVGERAGLSEKAYKETKCYTVNAYINNKSDILILEFCPDDSGVLKFIRGTISATSLVQFMKSSGCRMPGSKESFPVVAYERTSKPSRNYIKVDIKALK